MYTVHNLREGSRDGNWIRYWEEATGLKAKFCHKVGCLAPAEDGAHVQLSDPNNHKWYIIPLCHKCNCQFGAEFDVIGPLVNASDPTDILW